MLRYEEEQCSAVQYSTEQYSVYSMHSDHVPVDPQYNYSMHSDLGFKSPVQLLNPQWPWLWIPSTTTQCTVNPQYQPIMNPFWLFAFFLFGKTKLKKWSRVWTSPQYQRLRAHHIKFQAMELHAVSWDVQSDHLIINWKVHIYNLENDFQKLVQQTKWLYWDFKITG